MIEKSIQNRSNTWISSLKKGIEHWAKWIRNSLPNKTIDAPKKIWVKFQSAGQSSKQKTKLKVSQVKDTNMKQHILRWIRNLLDIRLQLSLLNTVKELENIFQVFKDYNLELIIL